MAESRKILMVTFILFIVCKGPVTQSRVEALTMADMLRVGTSYKSPLVARVATSYVEKV